MSALIVTLDPGRRDDARAARVAIEADGRFTLGPSEGERLALVLDTPDPAADEAAYDWLRGRPGVSFVHVVAVVLDPLATPEAS